jgi:hypothetical protein
LRGAGGFIHYALMQNLPSKLFFARLMIVFAVLQLAAVLAVPRVAHFQIKADNYVVSTNLFEILPPNRQILEYGKAHAALEVLLTSMGKLYFALVIETAILILMSFWFWRLVREAIKAQGVPKSKAVRPPS